LALGNGKYLLGALDEFLADIDAAFGDNVPFSSQNFIAIAVDDVSGFSRCWQAAELFWAYGDPSAELQPFETLLVGLDISVIACA
jgi:hypothetical protein